MRVLILSWEYPPVVVGGLGRHVHALSEALARAGHEVTVVSRHAGSAPFDEVLSGAGSQAGGQPGSSPGNPSVGHTGSHTGSPAWGPAGGRIRVVRVPEDPPVFPFDSELLAWTMAFNHALTRAALKVAEQSAPQVVHAHDWLVAHTAATLKHHLGVPLVSTVHATEAGRHQGWLPGPLNKAIHSVEWWLTYEARRVISCSSYMRWEVTRLFDLPPDKVDVIPNGVALDRWRCEPALVAATRARFAGTGPLVVFAGRLVYEKGVHDLLRAMPRLRRRHPGIRLVVAGDGPHDEELRAQASALRLGRSVTFAGFLDEAELAALAAAADAAVVPSIYEPFGMVALEAAAAGTPLVVADVGGLREFVEHGITGLRFAPGDHAGLAEAVTALLSDEVLARRMARAARTVVERDHGWAHIADQVASVYQRAEREERALQDDLAGRALGRAPLRMVVRDGNLLTGESS